MRCDTARRLLSERIDAPLDASTGEAVEGHLDACAACRGFAARLEELRRHLHLTPVGAPPDVAPRIRRVLEEHREGRPADHAVPPGRARAVRRWLPPVAAAFVAAFVLGGAVVGLTGPRQAEATDVSSLVQAGQRELQSLSASVDVREHGWHPDVPARRYEGRLDYRAPETFVLTLEDVTDYPPGAWRANDVTVVVDGDRSWSSGLAACPPAALPDCTPDQPRVRIVEGREAFDRLDPVPLDLVLPVSSFLVGTTEETLGTTEVAGRTAIGVEVTAAQLAPLLDGLHRAGNLRPIHPTDGATVWLDAELGVPLAVRVIATPGFERDRWAAAGGLSDEPGATILAWSLTEVHLNTHAAASVPAPPTARAITDRGFRSDPVAGLVPTWLPEGMTPHRAGRVGDVEVASFSDGRAWVAVRSTHAWDGRRLFGQQAGVVRTVDVGEGGVAYLPEGGDRVLLHGDGIDVELTGSVPTDELLRIAASLEVTGRRVPDTWLEATTVTLAKAATDWPGLLTLPPDAGDLEGPAVASSEHGVVQGFAGSGTRALVLTQSPGDQLGPPLDDLALGVEVRGRSARYTPDRGSLEWIEGDRVITLRSRTLGLEELAALAELLAEAP